MAWLDIFTGVDSEQTQRDLDETDAKLRALEADYQRRHRQTLDDEAIERRNAEFEAHMRAGHIENVENEVNDAFDEGLDEGAANIRGAIGDTINKVVVTPLSIIPWQVWVAGALYLAWQLGWLRVLTGKLKA